MVEDDPHRKVETRESTPGFETPTAVPLEVSDTETPEPASGSVPPRNNDRQRSFWSRVKGLWVVDVWYRFRPILIGLTVHALIFGVLIGTLILFHYVIEFSGLPPEQKEILDKVHFYGSVATLVIYTLSFIIKALVLESRGKHGE